ncbi:Cobalt-precorrin-5B C(1)-methyltransferase [Actinidia chinensis var. chinensis]|uniref:Cobalt-precorrin-5B C(1)-methyltransferase n=1 Tax=Actinidia chinensis var. chinensis TaxID=1590841 RepID=A0A2R6RFE5_ACTCC|nr:Cobalt-precorrin-5B C(1)-methyltransferase [Actinidia chinensis var. chinensis]
MVYVGQLCLSWEILHWQYEKTRELLEYDCEHHHTYNQVAGEFQHLQVLVQRFVENELFQGPRVQNYTKTRFELCTLLQVPVIKDDCSKDKKESVVEEENIVLIEILTEFIDESMRVFWEFLRADKDEASRSTHVHLQDPSDSELLIDIKTSLQKKERRLKDIVRSGNCIVKKFQKHQEGRMDRALLFAQVELKLVARVLNTSRLTTDQLVWCQKKLNKISFFNRKIHVEPSFLLFPV